MSSYAVILAPYLGKEITRFYKKCIRFQVTKSDKSVPVFMKAVLYNSMVTQLELGTTNIINLERLCTIKNNSSLDNNFSLVVFFCFRRGFIDRHLFKLKHNVYSQFLESIICVQSLVQLIYCLLHGHFFRGVDLQFFS